MPLHVSYGKVTEAPYTRVPKSNPPAVAVNPDDVQVIAVAWGRGSGAGEVGKVAIIVAYDLLHLSRQTAIAWIRAIENETASQIGPYTGPTVSIRDNLKRILRLSTRDMIRYLASEQSP